MTQNFSDYNLQAKGSPKWILYETFGVYWLDFILKINAEKILHKLSQSLKNQIKTQTQINKISVSASIKI